MVSCRTGKGGPALLTAGGHSNLALIGQVVAREKDREIERERERERERE